MIRLLKQVGSPDFGVSLSSSAFLAMCPWVCQVTLPTLSLLEPFYLKVTENLNQIGIDRKRALLIGSLNCKV